MFVIDVAVMYEPVGAGWNGCAGVAQLVELQFSKLNVASSSLVARSKTGYAELSAHVAQW